MSRRGRALLVAAVVIAGCSSSAAKPNGAALSSAPAAPAATTTSTAPVTSTSTTTTVPTTTTTVPPGRHVMQQDYIPFAVAGDVTLHFPSSRVEHVGFHQSNDEGAQHLDALPGIEAFTLDDRGRETDRQGSADVVVDPETEIRAPVSGTVISSGSYVLYCNNFDYYLNIEPDDHPGWKVRMLHLAELTVGTGDRVEVGQTVVATKARQLPFASQVDDIRTADPAWPHVHMEVVDPSIPNVPNPGSGSENC